MKLKEAFYKHESLPMKTIQRGINMRPHLSFKGAKTGSSRFPKDIRPRYKQPIPPKRKG